MSFFDVQPFTFNRNPKIIRFNNPVQYLLVFSKEQMVIISTGQDMSQPIGTIYPNTWNSFQLSRPVEYLTFNNGDIGNGPSLIIPQSNNPNPALPSNISVTTEDVIVIGSKDSIW